MNNKKSQAFFSDFVIALLIFTAMIIIYFAYTTNLPNQDAGLLEDILSDAKAFSSSLTSSGYPNNWNANNVVRIGFTDNNNKIDNPKFNEFNKINYNKSKKLLGTIYDYFLFFVNESDDLQNIEGICGNGNSEVEIEYDIKAAYFYKDAGGDQFLKNFMVNKFNADVYTKDGDEPDAIGDLCDLTNVISNYGVVVLEAPEMSAGAPCGKFGAFKSAADAWVNSGGFLMISGELVTGQNKVMVGGSFNKGQGLSSSQEHATVVNEDEFLDFELASGLIFDQGFTVEDAGATNFNDIARFNESDIEFEDILDNKIAIARWKYGDGKVIFFSDFDATYFVENFQENLEESTKKWIGANCLPFDFSNIKRENLVKIDRLLIYKSDIVKMVLYLWQ